MPSRNRGVGIITEYRISKAFTGLICIVSPSKGSWKLGLLQEKAERVNQVVEKKVRPYGLN